MTRPTRLAPGDLHFQPIQHGPVGLWTKVALRAAALPAGEEPTILDAFAGEGDIWREVRRLTGRRLRVVGIDTEPTTRLGVRRGDNTGVLMDTDLSHFDAIDLDAWGMPAYQLKALHDRGYTGPIYLTWLMTGFGTAPAEAMDALGIPREWKWIAPMQIRKMSPEWAQSVLASLGYREITAVTVGSSGSAAMRHTSHGLYGVLNAPVDPGIYTSVMAAQSQGEPHGAGHKDGASP